MERVRQWIRAPRQAGPLWLAALGAGLAGPLALSSGRAAAAERSGDAPADAPIVEMRLHPSIRALTATLANGVRVHHRFMPYRKGQATVEIALAGGRLDETEQTRGATEIAVGALAALLRDRLGSNAGDMAPIDEQRLAIAAWADPRAAHVRLAGPTERLPEALTLLASQLQAPDFAQAHLDAFLQSRRAWLRERDGGSFRVMWGAVQRALHPPPDAERLAPAPIERLERFTPIDAQRWTRETLAQAPIEIAIVGDAPRAQALDMIAGAFGGLPPRAMTAGERLAAAATMPRPAGLGVEAPVIARVDASGDRALVFVYLETPADLPARAEAALEVFAQALPDLLNRRAGAGEAADGLSIRAYHRSGGDLFEKGLLAAHDFVPVEHAEALANRLSSALKGEAIQWLSDAAIAQARAEVSRRHDEQLRDPQAWASLLVDVGLQGIDPARIADALAAVENVRLADVRDSLRAAVALGRPGRVIVAPARSGESEAAKEDDPTRRPSHPPGAGG